MRIRVQRRVGRRWRTVTTKRVAGTAGRGSVRLGRAPRGTIRALVVATDAAGNAGTQLTLRPARR